MKKILAILIALSFIITGCGDNNKEKALRFDVEAFPRTLDAQMAAEKEAVMVLVNTMSGLTKTSPEGKAVPDLCESWETEKGGREYIFHLREGLLWENGTPLTSRDFQFALRRLLDPVTNSPFAYRYMNILNADKVNDGTLPKESLGVRCPDDKTLVISLNEPDLSFPSLMAQVSSYPCNEEFFDSCKGKYGLSGKNFLSCGAFTLNSVDGNLMLLKSNDKALNPAKTEKLYLCKDRGPATDVFLDGRSEAAIVPFNEYEKIKSYDSSSVYNKTFALIVNPESRVGRNEVYREALLASPLFSDNEIEGQLRLIPAEGIIPPATLLEDINYREAAGSVKPNTSADLDELKVMVQDEIKNEKDEKFPKTEIITGDDDINFTIASEVQNIYSTGLSVYINISPLGDSELSKKVSGGNFEIALTRIDPMQDKPSMYLVPFSGIMINHEGEKVTVGSLLEKAELENNKQRQALIYRDVEKALIDGHYVLPLYHAPTYIVSAPTVSGIEYLPAKQTIFFGNAVINSK